MTYDNDNHRKHGSAAGAVWIGIAIVIALIFVSAVYSGDHSGNTASKGGTPASQTTGSGDSRSKTGSDTSSTGGR